MTLHRNEDTLTWDRLPSAITSYLTAQRANDTAAVMATLTADAVVIDEGHTYRGTQEIAAWVGGAASEYTYTTEFTGATQTAPTDFDVTQHLEGDFPGGVADLHFRFTLDGELISRLVIEP